MTDPGDIFEQAKLFLPKYLTPQQTKDLFSELTKFPDIEPFYLSRNAPHEDLLQGDGCKGFIVINFHTGMRKSISGVILSNSWDIALENDRNHPVSVLFTPLIALEKYAVRLTTAGKAKDQVETILSSIRRQRVTSIFYLPECPGQIEESILLLDDIHAHPLDDFLRVERQSIFTLNQSAFYLFLIKLSIHFCRFNEKIQRFDQI